MANQYTDEYRRETADHVISTGRPVTEAARELRMNAKAAQRRVTNRRRRLDGGCDPGNPSPELAAANKRIRGLETGNEFLKKAAAFFADGRA